MHADWHTDEETTQYTNKEQFEQGIYPLNRDLITTVELFDYLKIERRIKVTRERDVAAALKLIGGVRIRGCPVNGVGNNVNVWVIRDHEKYKNMTAKELGKEYVGFYTESVIGRKGFSI